MRLPVCDVMVSWDGQRLIAEVTYGTGASALMGYRPDDPKPIHVACFGPSDMTSFELGVFLALAARHFTDSWVTPEDDPQLMLETLRADQG